jgi:type II secretory pathway pseudopilin PulG
MAIVIVIVGVAGVALLTFMTSATRANTTISERAIALSIARAGHEWAASRTRSELDAWFQANPTGKTSELLGGSGIDLVDTDGSRAAAYRGWSQQFIEEQVSEGDPMQTQSAPAHLLQITVKVSKGTAEQCSLTRLYSDFTH